MRRVTGLVSVWLMFAGQSSAAEPADTGISGVYEVMVGVPDAAPALEYFAQFGFAEVASAEIPAARAAGALRGRFRPPQRSASERRGRCARSGSAVGVGGTRRARGGSCSARDRGYADGRNAHAGHLPACRCLWRPSRRRGASLAARRPRLRRPLQRHRRHTEHRESTRRRPRDGRVRHLVQPRLLPALRLHHPRLRGDRRSLAARHQRVHASRLRRGGGFERGHRLLRNRVRLRCRERSGHRRRLAGGSSGDIPDGAGALALVPGLRFAERCQRQAQVLLAPWPAYGR